MVPAKVAWTLRAGVLAAIYAAEPTREYVNEGVVPEIVEA